MHKLSPCHAVAAAVKPPAPERHVDAVPVQIGALRQVVPESLEFCRSLVCQHLESADVDFARQRISGHVGRGVRRR